MGDVDTNGLGEPLFSPTDAKVDIVFVHGLGGDRVKTWSSVPTKDIPTSTFWPKDLLPKTCKTARILSFGYDASFAHFYPLYGPKRIPVGTTTDDHSTALLQSLNNIRADPETKDRPIIFVAHSLGGLVCANALSRQHGTNEANKRLVDNTRGLIFLGTPFEGSAKARWGSLALRYLSIISSTNNEKVKDLEERSQKIVSINEAFLKFLKVRDRTPAPVEVACFFEEYPTYVAGKNLGMIVPKDSASLPGIDLFSIAANHVDMCKFEDEYRNGYTTISNMLNEWIKEFDEPPPDKEKNQASIRIGDTNYNAPVEGNSGVVAGTLFSTATNGNVIKGAEVSYYGDNWQPNSHKAERRAKGKSNDDL